MAAGAARLARECSRLGCAVLAVGGPDGCQDYASAAILDHLFSDALACLARHHVDDLVALADGASLQLHCSEEAYEVLQRNGCANIASHVYCAPAKLIPGSDEALAFKLDDAARAMIERARRAAPATFLAGAGPLADAAGRWPLLRALGADALPPAARSAQLAAAAAAGVAQLLCSCDADAPPLTRAARRLSARWEAMLATADRAADEGGAGAPACYAGPCVKC